MYRNEKPHFPTEYEYDESTGILKREHPFMIAVIYLVDCDIIDQEHPFYVYYSRENDKIIRVTYYSSERVKNNLPISISFDNNEICSGITFNNLNKTERIKYNTYISTFEIFPLAPRFAFVD